MYFNDISVEKDGLIQDCEFTLFSSYATISGNADLLATFTRLINRRYDRVATLIMAADGRWQWDDTNQTDNPIGTADVVSGQQAYVMDVEHLKVQKVLVKDSTGGWHVLTPIDINDPDRSTYLINASTNTGLPTGYDKQGTSIYLDPVPNYSSTGGLKIYYQRKPSYFVTTDTTNKKPGIPALFHNYLSQGASSDYAIQNSLSQKNDLAAQVADMEQKIQDFYSTRNRDEHINLSPRPYSFN